MNTLIKKIKENVVTNVMVAVILGFLAVSFNATKSYLKKPSINERKQDSLERVCIDLQKQLDYVLEENKELKNHIDRLLDVLIKEE